MRAKDIVCAPIAKARADALVRRLHYSRTVVRNSQLHVGVFIGGRLEGALQFGPPMAKRTVLGLVRDTPWNGMVELNRLAFSERLPRNSESRALGVTLRLLRKHVPHCEWVLSFADACRCGDGTIYRAAGFLLTGIKRSEFWRLPPDLAALHGHDVVHKLTVQNKSSGLSREVLRRTRGGNLPMAECARRFGGELIEGFQLRYVYFLKPKARQRLAVPVLPYSAIAEAGAAMYRGEKVRRR